MTPRKRVLIVLLPILFVAAALLATPVNNFLLYGPGTGVPPSLSGTQVIGLPFQRAAGLSTAADLINDINAAAGASVVSTVGRFITLTDGVDAYTGAAGSNFSLTAPEGYFATVSSNLPFAYNPGGAHIANSVYTFDGPGATSLSGTHLYSVPCVNPPVDAAALINQLRSVCTPPDVTTVSQFRRDLNGLVAYTGAAGTNFTFVPGEAIFIGVSNTVTCVIP